MYHNFHIVTKSGIPLFFSLDVVFLLGSLLVYMKYLLGMCLLVSVIFSLVTLMLWMKDIMYEGVSGYHNEKIVKGFKLGFNIFIFTEIMFFFSIFGYYLYVFFMKTSVWAPASFSWFVSWGLPLFGTIILLSSSVTGTWAHNCMLKNNSGAVSLFFTLILGMVFLIIQITEYMLMSFSSVTGVSGSMFFFSTGFHGLHVVIGMGLILICFCRLLNNNFNKDQHLLLGVSLLYWHFVDIVWFFLWSMLYSWPVFI